MLLTAMVGLASPAVAEVGGSDSPSPSLEYRPPRPVLPVPKAPTPAPPVMIFREAIGGYGMLTGSFDTPVDVAWDERGNFYVLDAGNSRVQKFDSFKNYVLSWGSSGYHDGEFNKPQAIAVSPLGSVYVADTGNHRIQQFDQEGNHVRSWGSLGSRNGDLKFPTDVTVDGAGNVYVLDSGNERVQQFDAVGTPVNRWGSTFGVVGGIFKDLTSIAWSDERFGYLYLLSAGCLVQQFKIDGSLVSSWSAVAPESGMCVPARIEVDNKNGYVYVLDSGNSLLVRFNRDGMYRAALRGAERPFSKPLGFVADASGDDFLVADTGNNIVQKFTLR